MMSSSPRELPNLDLFERSRAEIGKDAADRNADRFVFMHWSEHWVVRGMDEVTIGSHNRTIHAAVLLSARCLLFWRI
jgi:hypothetical protein